MGYEPKKTEAEVAASAPEIDAVDVSDDELDDVAGGIIQPDGRRNYPPGTVHIMDA